MSSLAHLLLSFLFFWSLLWKALNFLSLFYVIFSIASVVVIAFKQKTLSRLITSFGVKEMFLLPSNTITLPLCAWASLCYLIVALPWLLDGFLCLTAWDMVSYNF